MKCLACGVEGRVSRSNTYEQRRHYADFGVPIPKVEVWECKVCGLDWVSRGGILYAIGPRWKSVQERKIPKGALVVMTASEVEA